MDHDEEQAALYHQWELEQQQSELEKAIEKLENLNKRQNERFKDILQENDKCYLQKRQAKISR
jgi:hypothetical protein